MNTLRNLLAGLAFVFAIGAAFASVQQQAWYDANGPMSGGGTQAEITTPENTDVQPCLVQSGTQCKIRVSGIDFNAYNTQANAEAGGSVGLLKFR